MVYLFIEKKLYFCIMKFIVLNTEMTRIENTTARHCDIIFSYNAIRERERERERERSNQAVTKVTRIVLVKKSLFRIPFTSYYMVASVLSPMPQIIVGDFSTKSPIFPVNQFIRISI